MSRVHRIELLCEIDPHRESIHGEMSDRHGETVPFSGWTEFAGALVSLIKGEAGGGGHRSPELRERSSHSNSKPETKEHQT